MTKRTVYLGYGSNLWREQMAQRCPQSHYLGLARLNNFRWIINDRGYANVVEISDDDDEKSNAQARGRNYLDEVWGLVYSLTREDERLLDGNEGVPECYGKEILEVDYWTAEDEDQDTKEVVRAATRKIDVDGREPEQMEMLVYVDRKRTLPDVPKKEYIYRMNMGIRDALAEGLPQGYVRDVMRKFIPDVEDRSVEEFAKRQALKFEDEN